MSLARPVLSIGVRAVYFINIDKPACSNRSSAGEASVGPSCFITTSEMHLLCVRFAIGERMGESRFRIVADLDSGKISGIVAALRQIDAAT